MVSSGGVSARARGISIAVKLTAIVALVLLPVVIVLMVLGHRYWREMMSKATRTQLMGVAANRAELVEVEIRLLRQRAAFSADRAEFRRYFKALLTPQGPAAADREWIEKRLTRTLPDKKVILGAALISASGEILLSTDAESIGRSLGYTPGFYAGLREPYLGTPRPNAGADKYRTLLIAPIVDKGETLGFLSLYIDVTHLVAVVQKPDNLARTGEVLLAAREGPALQNLIASRNGAAPRTPAFAAGNLASLLDAPEHFGARRDYRQVPVLVAAHPVGYSNWWLLAKIDQQEAFQPSVESLRWRFTVGGGLVLLGLAATYALVYRFTRPIRRLASASANVAGGDYRSEVPACGHDEMGMLSRAFNEMIRAVRTREAERDHAHSALAEEQRRKDEFLTVLGHELRNPLSAIAGATQLLEEEGSNPRSAEEMRNVIARQTGNLKRLVDDLLDVARIAAGAIELRKRPVEVRELATHAINALRPVLRARRHELRVTLAQEPLYVNADPIRLDQIISNLLTNAAKYTPEGGQLGFTAQREADQLVLSVSDNGIGIEPDALERIFGLFEQENGPATDRSGGLGIGLHLCRRLVEMHGGTIAATSEGRGCGAHFEVRLPLTTAVLLPPPERILPPASTRPAPPRRILIVDDDTEAAQVLLRLLTRRGHEVRAVHDGKTAFVTAAEFRPEVFLLDIGLPDLDGFELAERLRAEGFSQALFLAASGFPEPAPGDPAKPAVFAHYFSKPLDFDHLLTFLAQPPVTGDQHASSPENA